MGYHHFSIEERVCLREYYIKGYSYRKIAKLLGRNVSSVSRELRRNCTHMYDIPTYYPHIPKGPTDKAFIKMISDEQKSSGRSLPIYALLVMNKLKNTSKLTLAELVQELHITESIARSTVEELVYIGIVEAFGQGRGRYYMLSATYYKKTNNSVAYVRQKGIDSIRYNELVMQLLNSKGKITRKDVVDLLHITEPQAYRILTKLSKNGQIKLVGKGAGAAYIKQ